MFHYKDHTLNESHKGKGCHNLGHIHHGYTLEIENKVVRIGRNVAGHASKQRGAPGVNVILNN